MKVQSIPRNLPVTVQQDHRKLWFQHLAESYVRRRANKELDGVWVHGLEEARNYCNSQPVIFAANHVAWWDAMLLLCINKSLETDGFAVMDADNLDKLPFFRWVGALGIRRDKTQHAFQDLKTCAHVLTAPRRSLWIFPQGRQRPAHLRPLEFRSGVIKLAQWTNCPIIPVSIQYSFREQEHPSACFNFGKPISADAPNLLTHLESSVENGLSHIDSFLDGKTSFSPLITPTKQSTTNGFGARILSFFSMAA